MKIKAVVAGLALRMVEVVIPECEQLRVSRDNMVADRLVAKRLEVRNLAAVAETRT